jgi:hypothetical protein
VASVRLSWIPVGAGSPVVRASTVAWERLTARRDHRGPQTVCHAALEVALDGGRWTVEMAPAWSGPAGDHGVVVSGPVGLRGLDRWRWFRYDVRVWRDGTVPDLGYAVGGPVALSTDDGRAARLLGSGPRVPALTWGRDELGLGEMWNSNSVVAWLLATSGHDVAALGPPYGGRAPGWAAGLALAARSAPQH